MATEYDMLISELEETANAERNRIGRNPISNLLWEASKVISTLAPRIGEDSSEPEEQPKSDSPQAKRGRPKKASTTDTD